MRSLGTRRVALAAGAATVAVLALGACSAGQVAETALLQAPVSGLSTQSPDGRVQIRNLQVIYSDPEGYPANGDAPIEVGLYNQTTEPVTILISSKPLQNETEGVVSARQIGLSGGSAAASPSANPEPSGGPSGSSAQPGDPNQAGSIPDPSGRPSEPSNAPTSAPAAATLQPARITIPALSSATFLPDDDQKLVAAALSDELKPGNSLSLVFEISGYSQPLEVLAPVAIPLSPASRAPVDSEENE
ncbi:hypothetical protein OWR29_31855 [Actinoplanes sp. Pm04-4]|uniref:Lipoprotein n=1 Tax=Paractinoplanes pyxinae TaxID=2997416 RepID=A0ABT4B819_9ACTN|nr:hypothetical protein [Actinoplanes pyxinae]MCY1142616.1 hypothetical protein [Actinoplanes pyxinae]